MELVFGENSLLEAKIEQKQEPKMSQSAADELSRKEQIEKFLKAPATKSHLHDVSVKDMRHIIPLLLMEVYCDKYGSYTKKVKGLWENRPCDWPANVPFVDPNNKLKIEGGKNCKPKKELLGQMLHHLIRHYEEIEKKRSTSLSFDPTNLSNLSAIDFADADDLQRQTSWMNLMESEELVQEHISGSLYDDTGVFDTLALPLMSGETNNSCISESSSSVFHEYSGGIPEPSSSVLEFSSGYNYENGYLFCNPDQLYQDMSFMLDQENEPAKPPEQVMDNEDSNIEDWEPLSELVGRIPQKLQYLNKKKFMSATELDSMEVTFEKLREEARNPPDRWSLIDRLHDLEKKIDMSRSVKASKDRYSQAPPIKNDELGKAVDETDNMKENGTESKCKNADTYTEPQVAEEVAVPVEDPSLMNSLNIRTRRGAPPSSGNVGNLMLRSVPGAMPDGQVTTTCAYKASSLSEYCKPVQPAEDNGGGGPSQSVACEFLDEMKNNDFITDFPEGDFALLDDLSVLEISDNHVPPLRFSTPVQETDTASLSDCAARKADAISAVGNPSFSLKIMPVNNTAVMENRTAMSVASTATPSSFVITPEILQLIMQHTSANVVAQLPPVVVNDPPPPVSNGLQQRRQPVQPGGKRSYPMEEDDCVEMQYADTSGQIADNSGFNSAMIPTVVEEMSERLEKPTSRFSKKSRRMDF